MNELYTSDTPEQIKMCLTCELPYCTNCIETGSRRIPKFKRKIWTESDYEYLRANYNKYTNSELGYYFGVKPKSVEAQLKKMGLCKKREKYWKQEEDLYLLSHTVDETVKYTGRTVNACKSRLFVLKHKRKEY